MTAIKDALIFSVSNEGIFTLLCVLLLGGTYWLCAIFKKGTCKLDTFAFLLLSIVGAVAGIFIFGGAFKKAIGLSSLPQDVIWGGITGFVLTLYSIEQIMRSFRELFAQQFEPRAEKND